MATTDKNILQDMLDRVTNSSKDTTDEMAVDIFCKLIKNNIELITVSHDMLISKMYSNKQKEALKAVELLEECMSSCGEDFKKKTAKFEFLNKLIQLVIDRHNGVQASLEVKKRIMDCLLLWTLKHPDKTKICETYNNLKKQVKFEHCTLSSSDMIIEKPKSILGKDEELVSKLLNAGGTENYKKANLLIQHGYSQMTKRDERIAQHTAKLKETQNTIDLLNEMLDIYSNQPISEDNMETLRVLYNKCKDSCRTFSLKHERICDLNEDLFAETDVLYNKLLQCIERYNQFLKPCDILTTSVPTTITTATTTTQHSFQNKSTAFNNTLIGKDFDFPSINMVKEDKLPTTTMKDELNDIFGNIDTNSITEVFNEAPIKPPCISNLLDQMNLLETITTNKDQEVSAKDNCNKNEEDIKEKISTHAFKELKEIDQLSEELLIKNLKHQKRLKTFKKETAKITLNDIANDKNKTLHESKINEISNFTAMSNGPNKDNLIINEYMKDKNINNLFVNPTNKISIKYLSSINMDLDQLIPVNGGERILVNDEHLRVILNVTINRPQPQVYVMVLTLKSQSLDTIIRDVQFRAAVKKPCKLHLLPPSDTVLMPIKSFRHPILINQIILLWNPTLSPVDVTGIVQYKLGDDPEPFNEPVVAQNIPC